MNNIKHANVEDVVTVLPFFQGTQEMALLNADEDVSVSRVMTYFQKSGNSTEGASWSKMPAKLQGIAGEPRYFPRLGLIVGSIDQTEIDDLRKDRDVSEVHPSVEFGLIDSIELLESEPNQSWSLAALQIPEIWNRGFTGSGVLVGHLDSGVFLEHPALVDAIEALATIGADGSFQESTESNDDHGHGTHTAGIICGRPSGQALVGVAPGARLVSANVVRGDRPRLQLLAGLEWLLSRRIRILTLSVGVEPFNPVYQVVIDRLRASGVLPVAAIGNAAVNTSYSPANYRNAIGVGSMQQDRSVAVLSSSALLPGPPPYNKPDLVAPGSQILSTDRLGGYEKRSGTSQAAPCVAGIAALLMEANPQASIDQVEQAIFSSCTILDDVPAVRQGRGVVDPIAALERL